MPKVVFINAKECKVEVVEAPDLKALQALVEGYIEPVAYVKNLKRSTLCVDEEGLMKQYPYGFELDGCRFAGNGIIGTLGKTDTKISVADLKGRILFLR